MAKDQLLAQEWFATAISDYQYAAIGLKAREVFPQIAFLSQQVAEKFLKGFLTLHQMEPPRIHDLTKLLDECVKLQPELQTLRDACEALTGFYIEVRYPPELPTFTKADMQQAFDYATQVKQVIEQNIG